MAQQGDAGEILDPFYYVVLVCCGTPLECLQVDVDVYLAKRHLLPQLQGVIRDVLTLGRMHDATKRACVPLHAILPITLLHSLCMSTSFVSFQSCPNP